MVMNHEHRTLHLALGLHKSDGEILSEVLERGASEGLTKSQMIEMVTEALRKDEFDTKSSEVPLSSYEIRLVLAGWELGRAHQTYTSSVYVPKVPK